MGGSEKKSESNQTTTTTTTTSIGDIGLTGDHAVKLLDTLLTGSILSQEQQLAAFGKTLDLSSGVFNNSTGAVLSAMRDSASQNAAIVSSLAQRAQPIAKDSDDSMLKTIMVAAIAAGTLAILSRNL